MIKKIKITGMLMLSVASCAYADQRDLSDNVLYFDHTPEGIELLEFDQFDPLEPQTNSFKILEISYLSDNKGERWALMTFKNGSSGQRILKKENVVATFADGSQRFAINLNETFSGLEVLTRSVYFGLHRFPIVKVSVE